MRYFDAPRAAAYDWLTEAVVHARALPSASSSASWGDVLDAGTGPNSFRWLTDKPCQSITAVTAAKSLRDKVELMSAEATLLAAQRRRVILGNWADGALLRGDTFDVVLCDYVVGAAEHYSPYLQSDLVDRLLGLVRPQGLFLFTGLQPLDLAIQDTIAKDSNVLAERLPSKQDQLPQQQQNQQLQMRQGILVEQQQQQLEQQQQEQHQHQQHKQQKQEQVCDANANRLMLEVEQLRDASLLLSGVRPWREFPESWALSQIHRCGHFDVIASQRFGKVIRGPRLCHQLDWAEANAKRVAAAPLSHALVDRISQVRAEIQNLPAFAASSSLGEGHRAGWNYAIVARRRKPSVGSRLAALMPRLRR